MSLTEKLLKVNWPEESVKLDLLLKSDSKIYRRLAIFFAVASLIFYFLFSIVLILTVPLAAYLWYSHMKLNKKKPTALLFKILEKECWYRTITADQAKDPEFVDDSFTLYLFEIEVMAGYTLTKDTTTEPVKRKNIPSHIKVNKKIYNEFTKGEEAFFIFSPAGDLIGYYWEGKIETLVLKTVLGTGKPFETSISIPQDFTYPPKDLLLEAHE